METAIRTQPDRSPEHLPWHKPAIERLTVNLDTEGAVGQAKSPSAIDGFS